MVSLWPKIILVYLLQSLLSVAFAQVEITSVTVPEDYCPGVTATAVISPGSRAISVLFENYQSHAARGNYSSICQVKIAMKVAKGLRLGLISADYRGFAQVARGVEVSQQVLSSFNIDPLLVIFDGGANDFGSNSIIGPFMNDYYFRHRSNPKTVPRSNCDLEENILYIDIFLNVFAKNSAEGGTIMLDSADAEIPQKFGFDLVPCR